MDHSRSSKVSKSEKRSRERQPVMVVSAQASFPVSNKRKGPDGSSDKASKKRSRPGKFEKLLDWNETAKEVKAFGSQGFFRKKKKTFEDEEYKRLTG